MSKGDHPCHVSAHGDTEDSACQQRGKPSMKEVAACFHLPIEVAAKKLGVGQTWLKLLCRNNGVSRWPYRKIQSLQNSLDRSKKMQSLVEVAKVINKNLPKWLDLQDEDSDASTAKGAGSPDQDTSDTQHEEAGDGPQSSSRSASGSEGCSYLPARDWETRSNGVQHRRSEEGRHSQRLVSSPRAVASEDHADSQNNQWEKILQEAVARQSSGSPQEAAPRAVAHSGSAFKPVAKRLLRPEPRMPAPIDFGGVLRRPNPFQIMPLYQERLKESTYAPLAGPICVPQSYLVPSSGLEHLIAAATAKNAGAPGYF